MNIKPNLKVVHLVEDLINFIGFYIYKFREK